MLYLFILESIGTSELMLIGLVALIVFGPRKLPELARMLGKAMNEFRRSTDEFKKTWEQEIDLEKEQLNDKNIIGNNSSEYLETLGNPIQENHVPTKKEIAVPEIREISSANFAETSPKDTVSIAPVEKVNQIDKRDWL